MSLIADIVTAPARAWTAAVDAVARAKPKPRPPTIKKSTKPKKQKVRHQPVTASGTENLMLTSPNGQSVRFTTGEKLITESKLNEVLQPLSQRFDEFEREFDDVDRDLDENDKVTNGLVDEVNELQEENKAQHNAIEGLLSTTKALAEEVDKADAFKEVPEKEVGNNTMYLMSRRGEGMDHLALAMLSNGGLSTLSEVPLVRTKDGALVVDVVGVMVAIDLLGGLGIFGSTRELRAARERGDTEEVAKLSKLVAEELQGFVDASVTKAVEAALS